MYNPQDDVITYHFYLEKAISDAQRALPCNTNADQIAGWLLANRWNSFGDDMKNYFVLRALRSELCNWAEGQANYYARLGAKVNSSRPDAHSSRPDAPDDAIPC
jgi:hypothetical protein